MTNVTGVEKVKNGLVHCTAWNGMSECQPKSGYDCPYDDEADCKLTLHRDSLSAIEELQAEIERLKERVPKKGAWIFTGQKNAYGGIVIECPFCEDKYAVATPLSEHFCRNCGAKLMD